MNSKMHDHGRARTLLVGLILLLVPVAVTLAAGNMDATNKWAWGTNVGWVNFSPSQGGVTVYNDHLEGYAWAENIGWIRLGTCTSGSPCTYGNTSTTNYGVNNDGAGNLSGYAWSTSAGWINFDPAGTERVTINPDTGDFNGYAWGENIGYIHFQKSTAPAYEVKTTWRSSVPHESILGSVNGDTLVDSTDALIILSADVGVNASQFCPMDCGDVNGDGHVNSTDALIILSYDVGRTVPYPIGQSGCPSGAIQPPGCSP